MKNKILITFLLSLNIFNYSNGCTTFVINDNKGNIAFGRNFDFPIGLGHIQINYKNMQKNSFIRPPETPLTWTSKYGSITFNQAGREFPYGGINEKGLVIEQMWLQEAHYPKLDERYGMSELQWIQYQLDNSASVQEVIDSDSMIRISIFATSSLHFLISDANGNSATVEYIDGKMLIHQKDNLPFKVLTNNTYQDLISYKNNQDIKRQKNDKVWTNSSNDRFMKTIELIKNTPESVDLIDYSYLILDSVSQSNSTQWSIVYDIKNLRVYYKSSSNHTTQEIDLSTIDFSCKNKMLFIPISETYSSTESLKELSYNDNFSLMNKVVEGIEFLRNNVPKEAVEASARYAESIICKE
ncbi:MAG: linear amide C-N hydrolase [Bacteroidota bacterium]